MEENKSNNTKRRIKSIERNTSALHLCCYQLVIQFTDSVSSPSEGRLALIQLVNEIVSGVLNTFHFLILSLQLRLDFKNLSILGRYLCLYSQLRLIVMVDDGF
jgi:hypothetical protein